MLLDRLPDGLDLGLPPTAIVVRRLRDGLDLTVTFHTTRAGLERRLPTLFEHTVTAGMVWVAWPKQAAVKRLGLSTDLNDNVVRAVGLDLGWVDVKVAALDETWSGQKFVRRWPTADPTERRPAPKTNGGTAGAASHGVDAAPVLPRSPQAGVEAACGSSWLGCRLPSAPGGAGRSGGSRSRGG